MTKRKCDEIDYQIHGADLQVVEVELDPSETVVAESGSMMFFEGNIGFETKFGDGSKPDEGFFSSLWSSTKRMVAGESLALTHFKNNDTKKRKVSFSCSHPGHIVPVDLGKLGKPLLCHRGSFVCAALGTELSVGYTAKNAGFFGGSGYVMQKLTGDGMVFMHGGGTVIKKDLEPGEVLHAECGSILGYTDGIDFEVSSVGGLKNMLFGGEGIFLAVVKGPGTVWLQSLPFSKFCGAVYHNIAPAIMAAKK